MFSAIFIYMMYVSSPTSNTTYVNSFKTLIFNNTSVWMDSVVFLDMEAVNSFET